MPAPLVSIALGLAQFAPQLMRFFGAGESSTAAAEKVVGIAQAITGTETPEAALARMREDAGAQFQFRMRTLELDGELEQAYLVDRQDARKRDVAMIQAGRYNYRADAMVIGAVVGLLACLITLVWFQGAIPGEVVGIVSTISGLFGACLRDAFQYEFGSSRGSALKSQEQTATMAALMKARGVEQ